MGLFDFLKDWKPKIKPEWKKQGWVDEDEFLEENFSPNIRKIIKEADEEDRTGLLTWQYFATLQLRYIRSDKFLSKYIQLIFII